MVSTGTEVMSTASRGDCTCKVVRFAAETTHPRFPATPLKDINRCPAAGSPVVDILAGKCWSELCGYPVVSGLSYANAFLASSKDQSWIIVMNYCGCSQPPLALIYSATSSSTWGRLHSLGGLFLIYFLMSAPSFNSWSNTHSLSSDNAMQACHHTTRLQWIVQCWTTLRNLGFYIFLRYDLPLSWMVFQICSLNIIFVYLSSLYFSYPFFWTTIIEIFGQRSSELYLTVTAGGER